MGLKTGSAISCRLLFTLSAAVVYRREVPVDAIGSTLMCPPSPRLLMCHFSALS
jgi:hypothetical protein